jgi:hypothetical protein
MDEVRGRSRRRAIAVALVVVVWVVTGCSAGGASAPLDDRGADRGGGATADRDSTSPSDDGSGVALACTQMGNAEGVSVDFSQVLSLEGGDYYAEVSVPSLGASYTRGFAGNDWYYPSGDVEADLAGEPVEVRVRVVTERGDVAYETSDVAEPVLHQPNGPLCDGENYRITLVATSEGELLPMPDGARAGDARGRSTEAVRTQCGVEHYTDGLREWRRVGGLLDDGAGGPPPGWNTPAQRGWMTPQGDGLLLFEDERGHVERFEPITDGWFPAPCG